jgi:hypothetical protein
VRRKCELWCTEANGSVASTFPRFREKELCVRTTRRAWKAKESIQRVQVPKGSYHNTRNVVCLFDVNYYFAAM